MIKKFFVVFLVISMLINSHYTEAVHADCWDETANLNNYFDNAYDIGGFILGNTTQAIFQDGLILETNGGSLSSSSKGLYDENGNRFLTDYFVSNLNGFTNSIYYTVNDYNNDRVRLYQMDVNKEVEDYCNLRHLTEYNYTYHYFDNLEISLANPEVGENIKLYFEKVETGEKGWIIEKKDIHIARMKKSDIMADLDIATQIER